MRFVSSRDFEKAVLDRHSGGCKYLEYKSFDRAMRALVKNKIDRPFPNTRLGEFIYFGAYWELKRIGICPNGLKFVPSVGSRVDLYHYTDAFFYLPLAPFWPVTIDLFNLDSSVQNFLRGKWEDERPQYSENDFQSDLFAYKKRLGEKLWKTESKAGKIELMGGWTEVFNPEDFREQEIKSIGRPKNHFILTPSYTENRERRKWFSQMVAKSFLEALKYKKAAGDG